MADRETESMYDSEASQETISYERDPEDTLATPPPQSSERGETSEGRRKRRHRKRRRGPNANKPPRGPPVSEENLSARPMCPGGHIFLGNSVLPDRIYCPPLG